ncbi:hypothetical protein [Spirosoma spitsbergense]|uniref:hypothetical protein n=1 Tax=Spirosoma spitsbergense TaxID=431554 RepID=UPI00037527E1|nr:hypothetical protein [Spirosoma spitsbergense]
MISPSQTGYAKNRILLKASFLVACCQFLSTSLYAQTGCPAITNTGQTSVTVCTGYVVDSLQVRTTAFYPTKIGMIRFDTPQSNPYEGDNGVYLGELISSNGIATMRTISFPPNTGTTSKTYYVYGYLKPTPAEAFCRPSALLTVTVKPNPTATVKAVEATCTGTVSAADGSVAVVGFKPKDTYELANNGIFSGTSYPIPDDGLIVRNQSRTGTVTTYGVRVYNSSGCYVEKVVMLMNSSCSCVPGLCIPFVIQRIVSRK